MMTKVKKTEKNQKLFCSKCFVTLDRLKSDGISEYLIKIVDENGKEKYICRLCFEGW